MFVRLFLAVGIICFVRKVKFALFVKLNLLSQLLKLTSGYKISLVAARLEVLPRLFYQVVLKARRWVSLSKHDLRS